MRLPKTRSILLFVVFVAVAFYAGRMGRSPDAAGSGGAAAATAEKKATIWTCSMHPQVRLPKPGKCPICFMDLIPADGGGEEDLGPRVLTMTETAMALAEIETTTVQRRVVANEISMVGKVAMDETRMAYITSWIAGRLDRLFVDYTGVTVRKDDHLVEIYSPPLYSAQQELLQAITTAKRLETSSLEILRTTSDQTVISAREKLRLYGLSQDQIQAIVERGVPDEHVTILAPIGGVVVHKNALEGMYVDEGSRIYTIADLTKVWVLLDAYELDLAWLRYGQDVEFRVQAYPGETFHGRIAFIDPLLEDRTRTVKVRLNVDNSDLRLKPDMFVSAIATAVLTDDGSVVDQDLDGKWMCPMHPEIVADGPGTCPECGMQLAPTSELGFVTSSGAGESLVIPDTAPLVTGKRAVVYVRVPGKEKPTFEGRVITLGPRAGRWYVVKDGLKEGEEIVIKGNFKIDSELQIRAKASMMNPEGGGPVPGHQHGGMKAPQETGDASGMPAGPKAPPEFRRQLGAVVDAYLDLHRDLAADEDARPAAKRVLESLEAVDMGLLEGEQHMAWMKELASLRESAEALAQTEDVEGQRTALAHLTEPLVRSLESFGYEREDGAVGVFHCPMAMDGEGANWLQVGDETENPYFGSAMLRCGSRERTIELED